VTYLYPINSDLAKARWQEFVFLHILHHGGVECMLDEPGPELSFCWCRVAKSYRATFHMPDPNPEWYPAPRRVALEPMESA
jgi:hypothetical protein